MAEGTKSLLHPHPTVIQVHVLSLGAYSRRVSIRAKPDDRVMRLLGLLRVVQTLSVARIGRLSFVATKVASLDSLYADSARPIRDYYTNCRPGQSFVAFSGGQHLFRVIS